VVPESSARLTGVMARSGSSASGLSSAISGAFQLVISCLKIPAMVAADRLRLSTSGRLKATAMGLMYSGTSMRPPSPQRVSARASSSSSSAASEPAKAVPPARNCSRPPPEPIGS
jgi:hypothetical protein